MTPKTQWFLNVDFFVHPLPVGAVLLTGLNDHYLKYHYPGHVTAKLSDFLGMFYFPLFLCALYILARNHLTRKESTYIHHRMIIVAMIISASLLISLNVSDSITTPLEATFSKYLFRINLTTDVTDLLALSSLALSYSWARRYFAGDRIRSREGPSVL